MRTFLEGETIIESKPYRELVGCRLMYLMLTTRPDLSTVVNFYSRFQSNAKLIHWKGLKRILRYVKGILNYRLLFKHNLNPEVPLQTLMLIGPRIMTVNLSRDIYSKFLDLQ